MAASTTWAAALQVEGVRYSATQDGARIVLDVSQKPDYKAFVLGDPYRLVVDLPPATWKTFKSQFTTGSSIVKSWASGTLDNGITRVIFTLKRPALVGNIFTLPKDDFNKNRLVIDLKPASENLFNARKGEISGNEDLKGDATAKPALKATPPKTYAADENEKIKRAGTDADNRTVASLFSTPKKYTIVVDPGHGGGDPGASSHGVTEKTLTLSIAKELKQQLEETGRYKVVLTRDRDVYIKLHDRVDISRKVGGDLFISIHADKIDRDNVRGTSMYTLSEKASDAETERLADEENNAGYVAGVDLGQESQDVADILLDLAMREKMNESNMFARVLTHSLMGEDVRLLPKSHRSAGFAVLKAPDVPSVLIETGFISNPEEAKLLSSGQFQRKLSTAILGGVDAYFRKMQALEKR